MSLEELIGIKALSEGTPIVWYLNSDMETQAAWLYSVDKATGVTLQTGNGWLIENVHPENVTGLYRGRTE